VLPPILLSLCLQTAIQCSAKVAWKKCVGQGLCGLTFVGALAPRAVHYCAVQAEVLLHLHPQVAELAVAERGHLVTGGEGAGERCLPSPCPCACRLALQALNTCIGWSANVGPAQACIANTFRTYTNWTALNSGSRVLASPQYMAALLPGA
jgi:hypothetical protein